MGVFYKVVFGKMEKVSFPVNWLGIHREWLFWSLDCQWFWPGFNEEKYVFQWNSLGFQWFFENFVPFSSQLTGFWKLSFTKMGVFSDFFYISIEKLSNFMEMIGKLYGLCLDMIGIMFLVELNVLLWVEILGIFYDFWIFIINFLEKLGIFSIKWGGLNYNTMKFRKSEFSSELTGNSPGMTFLITGLSVILTGFQWRKVCFPVKFTGFPVIFWKFCTIFQSIDWILKIRFYKNGWFCSFKIFT
jgi:hypothetical protein